MKETEKKKTINTMPKGIWEAGRPKSSDNDEKGMLSASTDLQGNGYPQESQEQKKIRSE